jgi:hypothetical protein
MIFHKCVGGASARWERSDGPEIFTTARFEVLIQHKDLVKISMALILFQKERRQQHTHMYGS